MEHEDQVDVTPVESEAEKPKKASDGSEQRAGNIDLEIPDALQDLLRCLSGNLHSDQETVIKIPHLINRKYGDFFRGGKSPTHLEVRLKVLKAIGHCKTLTKFDTSNLPRDLSVREWEALLIPMQNNLCLEKIRIYSLKSSETEKHIGPHLNNLLRHAHKIARLGVYGDGEGLRADLMVEVASGLRANVHQKLKKLTFDFEGSAVCNGDTSVVTHVAEMISLAPELNKLKMQGAGRIDGDAKEALSAALKGCRNLRQFKILRSQDGIADVLVEVYGRTYPRPDLESLELYRVEGLTGDGLALLTGSNIGQIHMVSSKLKYFNPSSWQSIGKGLLQPLTLAHLTIYLELEELSEEELQDLEKGLAEVWKVSERNPILEIGVEMAFGTSDEASRQQLNFLQNSVKDTYLRAILVCGCDDVSSSAFKSFVENLAFNTSVLIFSILQGRTGGSPDGWAHLFSHLRDNKSIATLSLEGCSGLSNDDFRELMDLLQVNFTLQEVTLVDTEWARDGKDALVQELLELNKTLVGDFSS